MWEWDRLNEGKGTENNNDESSETESGGGGARRSSEGCGRGGLGRVGRCGRSSRGGGHRSGSGEARMSGLGVLGVESSSLRNFEHKGKVNITRCGSDSDVSMMGQRMMGRERMTGRKTDERRGGTYWQRL